MPTPDPRPLPVGWGASHRLDIGWQCTWRIAQDGDEWWQADVRLYDDGTVSMVGVHPPLDDLLAVLAHLKVKAEADRE